jgi:hypothetical protein
MARHRCRSIDRPQPIGINWLNPSRTHRRTQRRLFSPSRGSECNCKQGGGSSYENPEESGGSGSGTRTPKSSDSEKLAQTENICRRPGQCRVNSLSLKAPPFCRLCSGTWGRRERFASGSWRRERNWDPNVLRAGAGSPSLDVNWQQQTVVAPFGYRDKALIRAAEKWGPSPNTISLPVPTRSRCLTYPGMFLRKEARTTSAGERFVQTSRCRRRLISASAKYPGRSRLRICVGPSQPSIRQTESMVVTVRRFRTRALLTEVRAESGRWPRTSTLRRFPQD